jgi:hypothetical protein
VTPGTALSTAGISGIPVTARRFVLGANIDISERRHVWSVALAQIDGKMTIQDIGKTENEPVQKVAGHAAVISPRNVYFVELGPKLLATASPANRRMLSRWLAFQDSNQVDTLPPYLIQAATSTDPSLMTMAIDLEDSVDPGAIRRGLTQSQVLASRENVDLDAVARTMAKVKGAKLTVGAGSPLTGDLTVDFDTDTGPIRDFAKGLLLETLQNAGLYVPDFDDWAARVTDRSINIHGKLSVNALRKLGTLIRTPAPSPEAADSAAYQAATPATRSLAASQRYFQSVTRILDDLKNDKDKTLDSRSGWYEHAANQLNNLPTLDVAPELIGFGSATSDQLLAMGTELKDVSTKITYVHHNSYYSAYGLVYGSPSGGYTPTRRVIEAIKDQASEARRAQWERIEDVTAKVRQQMTQKFNTQF